MTLVERIRPQAKAELRQAKMLINGVWVESMSGVTLTVENPAKRRPIAQIPRGDTADVARGARDRKRLGAGQPGLGQSPGHSYGGYKQSGIGREFS